MNNDNETNKLPGKRITVYLECEAVKMLKDFKNKTGMKISNIVTGLCRLLSGGDLDNKYNVLYGAVKKSLYHEEFKQTLINTECIIERFNKLSQTKFTKQQMTSSDILTGSKLWCSDCKKYCVVVMPCEFIDSSKLIGDLYRFKADSNFEEIIVVANHLYNNMDRQIVNMLSVVGISISCTLKLETELIELYK